MVTKHILSMTAALTALSISGSALAQQASPEVGLRAGSFIVTPEVTVEGRYADNYLGLTSNEVDSFKYSVAPSLSLRSDWNRHALQVTLGGKATFVEANSNDDLLTYGVDAVGVVDVTRAAAIKLSAGYHHNEENRGADDTPGLAKTVTEYQQADLGLEGRYKAGMVRVSPFASYSLSDYDDVSRIGGGVANNDDRDRQQYGYGLELGYEFMRGYEAFVRGEGSNIEYDDSVDDNGFKRDSVGYRGTAGVNFAITKLIEGRVGVGYGMRDYDDARFGNQEAIAVDVGLDWSVTALTTVNLEGFQRFNETTTASSAGTSEVGGKVSVVHSLRENINLSGYAGYSNEEFEGVARDDDRYEAGLKVGYLINRNFELGAGYDFAFEDQKTVGKVTENEVYIGLTARY